MRRLKERIVVVMGALALAACGTQQTASPGGSAPAPTPAAQPAAQATAPSGMSHGGMAQPAAQTTAPSDMSHGGMEMGQANGPYDARFIDSMVMHHQGAIAMAKEARQQAEQPELKQLAEAIITAQEQEISQLQEWRKAWYPDLPPTKGMEMEMGSMMIADDASKPFDLRFIEAMIPHHEGAIAMAKDAQQKAEHPEIRALANEIIIAQQAEIAQMQQWKQQWFPASGR